MSTSIPFPGSQSTTSGDFAADLKIDLPRNSSSNKEDIAPSTVNGAQPSAALHRRQGSFQANDKPSTAPAGWHHHPRQPGPHSESYFPGISATAPKTPSSLSMRGHGRTQSNSGATLSTHPINVNIGAPPPNVDGASLQSAFGATHHAGPSNLSLSSHPAMHGYGMGGGYSAGPPSPSTLTDVILGLHSTFYSCKRKPEEVKEMVSRYYERGAVFESPLLSAHGRNQIANQFIMAFALPGMDVQSELRDVICSDFEFDGTRAGIIDHTITVTLFPSLFGSSPPKPTPDPGASDANRTPRASYPMSASASAYPMTPHPFIDYGASSSAYSRVASHPHSPTTPFSISSIWGGSRPHTPGHAASAGGANGIRPLSGTSAHPTNTPPSVNGEDFDTTPAANNILNSLTNGSNTHHYVDAEQLQQELASRPAIPADALTPHWTSEGLGRQTFRTLVWSLFHPRAVLRSLCSIQLRVMSRLEFNDAGLIVRHEDTWGLRETIEGVIPFASLIYSIERRLVGFLVSWAIAKGFKLSGALLSKAIPGATSSTELEAQGTEHQQQISQHDAESMFTHPHMHAHTCGRTPGREFQTISRSRAPSPTRFRFGGADARSGGGTVTGTRSRARSLVGSHSAAPSRAISTDNLMHHFAAANAAAQTASGGGGESRRSADLPPDSSAKFRERSAKRIDGGRASSTNSAPPTAFPSSAGNVFGLNGHDGAEAPAPNLVNMWEHFTAQSRPHSKAASVVSNDDSRGTLRAPDQDQQ